MFTRKVWKSSSHFKYISHYNESWFWMMIHRSRGPPHLIWRFVDDDIAEGFFNNTAPEKRFPPSNRSLLDILFQMIRGSLENMTLIEVRKAKAFRAILFLDKSALILNCWLVVTFNAWNYLN